MKKILAVLALLVVMLAPLNYVPATADDVGSDNPEAALIDEEDAGVISGRQLDGTPTFVKQDCWTTRNPDNGQERKQCIKIGWHPQKDGTGVVIQDVWVTTPSGCDTMADSKYRDVDPRSYKHPEHSLWKNGDWGDDGCSVHHDFEWYGPDVGALDFRYAATVDPDVCCYQNYRIIWRAWVGASGGFGREALRIEQLGYFTA